MVFDSDANGTELLNAHLRQMMDQLSRLGVNEEDGSWSPPVDIFETTEAVVLVAEVAGVNRQEVRVIVDGGTVRIYGHRHPTCCNTGARYHRLEIASGAFVRSFRIGVPFVAEKVSARSEDGLLYITLPKERPGQD